MKQLKELKELKDAVLQLTFVVWALLANPLRWVDAFFFVLFIVFVIISSSFDRRVLKALDDRWEV